MHSCCRLIAFFVSQFFRRLICCLVFSLCKQREEQYTCGLEIMKTLHRVFLPAFVTASFFPRYIVHKKTVTVTSLLQQKPEIFPKCPKTGSLQVNISRLKGVYHCLQNWTWYYSKWQINMNSFFSSFISKSIFSSVPLGQGRLRKTFFFNVLNTPSCLISSSSILSLLYFTEYKEHK